MIALLVLGLVTAAFAIYIDPESLREKHAFIPYVIVTTTMAALFFAQLAWLRRRSRKGEILLHPPVFMTGWSVFMICLPGLAAFFDPELVAELAAGSPISYAYAGYGMALLLAGLLALWAGYILTLRIARPVRWLRRLSIGNITLGPLLGLYAATIVVRLIRISITGFAFGVDRSQLGMFQAFDQWFGYLDDSRWLVVAIWGLKVFQGEWKPFGFIVIAVIELAYAFTSGFMKPLLWLIIILFMIATYAGVRLKQHISLFAGALLLAILIVPVTEGIRKDFASGGGAGFDATSGSAIVASTARGFRTSWGEGFGVGWDIFEKKMLGREAMVSHMPGVIMSLTPASFEYEGFTKLFFALPSSLIPRALWSGKPELSRGVWFSHNYLNIPESIQTSSAPTIVGEAYWYRGWPATIFAMVFLGGFLAFLFRNTVTAGLVPLYASLLPNLDVEGQFTIMVLTLTQRFLIGLFTIWALIALSRQLRSRTSPKARRQNYTAAPQPGVGLASSGASKRLIGHQTGMDETRHKSGQGDKNHPRLSETQ